MSDFFNPMDCSPPGSSIHGDSPGKNTGLGCHALLQGIFQDPGVDSTSLACPELVGRFFTISTTWEAHAKGYTRVFVYFVLMIRFLFLAKIQGQGKEISSP